MSFPSRGVDVFVIETVTGSIRRAQRACSRIQSRRPALDAGVGLGGGEHHRLRSHSRRGRRAGGRLPEREWGSNVSHTVDKGTTGRFRLCAGNQKFL